MTIHELVASLEPEIQSANKSTKILGSDLKNTIQALS